MIELSPKTASVLAGAVYTVQNDASLQLFLLRPEFTHNRVQKQVLQAQVGGHVVCRTTDSFGVCAMGGKNYQKDMFLIFRGTNPKKTADLITNGRISLQSSKTGSPVHIGFNQVFSSMLPNVKKFIEKHEQQTENIHCIGHSLGGAVATLMADWVKTYIAPAVKLYTFGAPKVGLRMFGDNFTRRMKKENILRAYHPTDPVPMVPLFPYVHAPLPGFGHYIASEENTISMAAHSVKLYADSVKNSTWQALERRVPPYSLDRIVEQWLQSSIPVSEATPKIWEWLNAALIYVLKKVAGAAAITAQAGFIGLHNFIDTVAYILRKGIDLYESISQWVMWLMQKIMQVLSRKVPEKKEELTKEAIRQALFRIVDRANEEARKAIMRN